jgi:hypothetical protein
MIPAVNEMMLAVGSSLAASIVAKMTVVSALALFASWLARWNRAAVRHALLTAVRRDVTTADCLRRRAAGPPDGAGHG